MSEKKSVPNTTKKDTPKNEEVKRRSSRSPLRNFGRIITIVGVIVAILHFVFDIFSTKNQESYSDKEISIQEQQLEIQQEIGTQQAKAISSNNSPEQTKIADELLNLNSTLIALDIINSSEKETTPKPEASLTQIEPTLRHKTSTPTPKVWDGNYFDNSNFDDPVAFERSDSEINFNWGAANPAPNIPKDNFSVTWEKCLEFEEQYYIFSGSVDTNDRLWVYVDDIEVMFLFGTIGDQEFYVPAGNHCIRVQFREYNNDAFVFFNYEPADKPTPASGDNLWTASFYDNSNFDDPVAFERSDSEINFNWGTANPAPNIPKDNFSVTWEKCLEFEEQYYLFSGSVDTNDRLWVYVDDIEVMFLFGTNGDQEFYVPVGNHCIRVQFREYNNDAFVIFEYSRIGD